MRAASRVLKPKSAAKAKPIMSAATKPRVPYRSASIPVNGRTPITMGPTRTGATSPFYPGRPRPPGPPPKAPGLFANHGKKIAAGLAVGAMGGAMMSRTGKAVDPQTGLPKGMYNY